MSNFAKNMIKFWNILKFIKIFFRYNKILKKILKFIKFVFQDKFSYKKNINSPKFFRKIKWILYNKNT